MLEDTSGDFEVSTSQSQQEKKRVVDLEYFGEYITNEYEILERTLTYLNVDDLIRASHVCRIWKQVCDNLFKKRTNLRWQIRCRSRRWPVPKHHDYETNSEGKREINFRSHFALGFQLTNCSCPIFHNVMKEDVFREFEFCDDDRARKGTNIPGLRKAKILILCCPMLEIPYYTEKHELKFLENAEAGILFPEIDGFNMYIERDPLIINHRESLKGIFVSNSYGGFDDFEDTFLSVLQESSSNVALAGGIFDHVTKYSKKKGWKTENDLVNICFCGENVSCYSNVLVRRDKHHVENFMEEMKAELGTFDKKKQKRIAIITRCIGRTNRKYENRIFKQYFPDISAFTLLANGEIAYHTASTRTDENSIKRTKRSHISIQFSYSVAYFFITINLPR